MSRHYYEGNIFPKGFFSIDSFDFIVLHHTFWVWRTHLEQIYIHVEVVSKAEHFHGLVWHDLIFFPV